MLKRGWANYPTPRDVSDVVGIEFRWPLAAGYGFASFHCYERETAQVTVSALG